MTITKQLSPGQLFRSALSKEQPLQIVGAINAYSALLAQQAGFQAIYLSGAGVANASYAKPDLGFTQLDDVLIDVKRIVAACDLPLLVDIDTGWEEDAGIKKTIQSMIAAGAAAVHIEDQVSMKRCGHRPGKQLVPTEKMIERIKAAVDARTDSDFVVMARTDAFANEGFDAALKRVNAYIHAGADMIFPEALPDFETFKRFSSACDVPILANITEFGKTDLLSREALKDAGVAMALYPLSAFRAMNKAMVTVYHTIKKEGTQISLLDNMQTRDELYESLDYQRYEAEIDEKLK